MPEGTAPGGGGGGDPPSAAGGCADARGLTPIGMHSKAKARTARRLGMCTRPFARLRTTLDVPTDLTAAGRTYRRMIGRLGAQQLNGRITVGYQTATKARHTSLNWAI